MGCAGGGFSMNRENIGGKRDRAGLTLLINVNCKICVEQ